MDIQHNGLAEILKNSYFLSYILASSMLAYGGIKEIVNSNPVQSFIVYLKENGLIQTLKDYYQFDKELKERGALHKNLTNGLGYSTGFK